jgi:hypothetical protein
MPRSLAAVLLVALVSQFALGEVVRWEIAKREPYAGGQPRGDRGPYEQWTGVVRFALDPNVPANQQIVDLKLAPRNAEGQVEFSADFRMLVPIDLSKANGAVFYEVNNRGGATAPRLIEAGADDFLCRQGFVVLWSGWIAQVQPVDGKLRLQAPVATEDGRPISGIVREEVVVDRAVPKAAISHRGNQGSYRPTETGFASAKVTRRERQADPRQEVPRDEWKLVSSMVGTPEQAGQLPLIELEIAGGLSPGWIYEIVYEAEGPIVQGVGLAGIRDILSALKLGGEGQNPLRSADGKPIITRAIGFGTSQSGRLLRHFLWDGFNTDERGRKAFDGVISHVAGGGLGYFNHRFASPTRTNGQHDEHLFPADYFPFTYGDMADPLSGKTDGILRKSRLANTTPKVFHTQSSSEYWHRSGSLVHADPLGKTDAEIPPDVRIYTFGGTQHGSGSGFPGPRGNGQLPASPADYSPLMRALVVALDAWVKEGTEPPASAYPKIADGTLADWQGDRSKWPAIDGVNYPAVIHQPHYLDRGPKWDSERISSIEPPAIKGDYVVKVPAYDADGNERGCLNLPAITVPVATYTSWNLRHESIGAAGELLSLQGGYIPFAKDAAARAAAKDPRPSIAERYQSYAEYEQRYLNAAENLVEQRYLLAEDLPRLKALCQRFKPLFP